MSQLLSHLLQSTVFAGAAALLTSALRGNRASVRFHVWFCASIKFVIPLALLTSLGSQIHWTAVQRYATPVRPSSPR